MISRFLLFVTLVYFTNGAAAPFITPCNSDDSKCMKQSAQIAIPIVAAGIPELGVETMDPITMKHLDASSPSLKLVLNDMTGTGLKDCLAKKMQRDVANSKLLAKIQCTVDFVGKYEINGQLLILPIEGKGRVHVVLRKVVISVEADMGEYVGDDGLKHWNVKGFKHSYDLKEKSTIELENLFNGNELLGRAARDLIESSSNEIVKEVGPPIIKTVVASIIQNLEKIFKKMPVNQLSLD